MTYDEFIASKAMSAPRSGFEPPEALNACLFDFQRDCVRWALRRGKAALWHDCGLGKGIQQLVWACEVNRFTGGDVLILAPLAVAEQFAHQESPKFGIKNVKRCRDNSEVEPGITITNYHRIHCFDLKRFVGVSLDECFPPDTLIDVVENNIVIKKEIKDIRLGQKIINAYGTDIVINTHRRRIRHAVKIKAGGVEFTASENHPFFTARGWVAAGGLVPGDRLMQTNEAMRLVSEGIQTGENLEHEILRDILLCEMADESTGIQGEISHQGETRTHRKKEICMVCGGRRSSATRNRAHPIFESYGRSFSETKGEPNIASHWAQTKNSRREWNWNDGAPVDFIQYPTRRMDTGMCCEDWAKDSGLSNLLQIGHRESEFENRNRGRWLVSSWEEESTRPKAGCDAGFIRVEDIEVLEPGHSVLERYRDADGFVYFYDLEIERHPSFSVNGVLVHNCSIIKSESGHYRNELIEGFAKTPYKLGSSATPAPNDYMELGNHAEFLGVMSRSEMLSMFFVHDGGDTSEWRLKGHAEQEFWKWLASWAVMMRKPSDLGYDDGDFILPGLDMHHHVVPSGVAAGELIAAPAGSLNERRAARRESMSDRVKLASDLANSNKEQWIVWCDLNDEGEALAKSIDGAIEVAGRHSEEHKINAMMGFARGEIRVLVSKDSICGHGMNWQQSFQQVHCGVSDSWEKLYQKVRRQHRFGQKHRVQCHIVTSERESRVIENLKRKQADADRMAESMVKYMSEISSAEIKGVTRDVTEYKPTEIVEFPAWLQRCDGEILNPIPLVLNQEHGQGWTCWNADCVEVAKAMPSNSVHYSIYSPPFSSLYTYSNSDRDMGNSKDDSEFWHHYKFLVQESYRVMMPGRLVSVHCMNLPSSKQHHGYIGIRDFRGDIIRAFVDAGFIYHSEVVIWKDPVTAMQRTKALGLLHKQITKDSCMSRQGIPDYLVTFRKPGANLEPVDGQFTQFVGEQSNEEFLAYCRDEYRLKRSASWNDMDKGMSFETFLSVMIWQRYASPVWMDINPSDTLQKESARDERDERHIAPLQRQVVERGIELWSNPNDIVWTPFMGIGTEAVVALKMGRRAVGQELKTSYWKQAVSNCKESESFQQTEMF